MTKYRNILDSGGIEVSDITAFVGQNEAGPCFLGSGSAAYRKGIQSRPA